MNYKTVAVDSKFEVHETKTKQVITSFKNQDEAKKLMRHLNLGGGFDGLTPTFFIKNTKKVGVVV
jgi:hypothetical protein